MLGFHFEGVVRGIFDPGSNEFLRIFDLYPKNGSLLDIAVDKSIVKTLKTLCLSPMLAWSTVGLLVLQLVYLTCACLAISRESIRDPAIVGALMIMSYYLIIPGGPADWCGTGCELRIRGSPMRGISKRLFLFKSDVYRQARTRAKGQGHRIGKRHRQLCVGSAFCWRVKNENCRRSGRVSSSSLSSYLITDVLQAHWGEKLHCPELLTRLHSRTGVDYRNFAFSLTDYERFETWGQSNRAWIESAEELGEKALGSALKRAGMERHDLDALFVVSITGVASPSLDARLINRMALRPDIQRTPIFGLGCVGGAAGLTRAADYVKAHPAQAAAPLRTC